MKKTFLFFVLYFFSVFLFNSNAQTLTSNNVDTINKWKNTYHFSDTVRNSILKGMNVIKTMPRSDSVRDEEFYIILSEYQGDNIITINYCKQCIETKIIKSSDRFFNLKENLLLPIIFRYDLEYSSIFFDEKGFKTNILTGGYYIVFDNRGLVKKIGLSQ